MSAYLNSMLLCGIQTLDSELMAFTLSSKFTIKKDVFNAIVRMSNVDNSLFIATELLHELNQKKYPHEGVEIIINYIEGLLEKHDISGKRKQAIQNLLEEVEQSPISSKKPLLFDRSSKVKERVHELKNKLSLYDSPQNQ